MTGWDLFHRSLDVSDVRTSRVLYVPEASNFASIFCHTLGETRPAAYFGADAKQNLFQQQLCHHNKKYRLFGNESDIDVALVSSALFDKFWEQVFRYKYEGSYWPEYDQFVDYFFRGWMRPDKLPRSPMFPLREDWWSFFKAITNSGKYGDFKISGGLYKSYFFLENYQTICIQQGRGTN